MQVELIEASQSEKPVIRTLMQLYQYDMSEHSGDDPDLHGLFDYQYLDHYWTEHGRAEEGRIPFLIKVDGKLAGFVLVNGFAYPDGTESDHNVAEFFVLRKWRRHGVGRTAARELFRRLPGRWQVGQERGNLPAQRFWRAVIGEVTGGRYEQADSHAPGWDGPVQLFEIA